jgi:glycosyltransferase involved in cell wall biosynthesis
VHSLKLSHGWNLLEANLKLRRMLQAGRFDVIHSHLFFSNLHLGLCQANALRQTRAKTGAKRLTTFHSLEFEREPAKTPWKRLRRRFYERALRRLDAHTAVSQAIAEQVLRQKQLVGLKVEVIPNPLSEKIFEHRKPAVSEGGQPSPNRPFKIVVPARLIPEKGHRVLFSALVELNDPSIEVHCYGRGPLDSELRRFISSHHLEKQVILHEPLSQIELWDQISASDLVVLPSLSEGFGMAAAEAMALEVPVIASRIGGLAEVIVDSQEGLLFDPGDVKSLAAKIVQIRNDSALRAKLTTAGRKKIESYRPKLIAKQWRMFYESLTS